MGIQKTFDGLTSAAYEYDNGGGAASNWKETVAGTRCVKPVDTDWIKISANCTCSTDESAAVLSGGTSLVDAGVTLTMATGGHIKVQDRAFTFNATAVLAFDGGTVTFKRVSSSQYFTVKTITCTANGGTINLPSDSAGGAQLYTADSGLSWRGYSTAVRLVVDGSGGTNNGAVLIYSRRNALVQYVEFKNLYRITPARQHTTIDGCLIHDFQSGAYLLRLSGASVNIFNSYIYNGGVAGTGLSVYNGRARMYNVVFGKDELGNASANGTADIGLDNDSFLVGKLDYCELASATPVSVAAFSFLWMVSNAHNKVKNAFKYWWGAEYVPATFETEASGQSGIGTKIVTGAYHTSGSYREKLLIGMIPATHGQTIDVTVYCKGTTGKTATLWIDPDSLYGTAQSESVAGSTGNWVQETIATYTVNTSAGLKHAVPVYIDVTGASETWYVDTLDATVATP